jgi:hypothetical protein
MATFQGVLQTLNTGRKGEEFQAIRSWSIGKISESMGPKGPIYRTDSVMLICQKANGNFCYQNGKDVTVREHLEGMPEDVRDEALAWFDEKHPQKKKA